VQASGPKAGSASCGTVAGAWLSRGSWWVGISGGACGYWSRICASAKARHCAASRSRSTGSARRRHSASGPCSSRSSCAAQAAMAAPARCHHGGEPGGCRLVSRMISRMSSWAALVSRARTRPRSVGPKTAGPQISSSARMCNSIRLVRVCQVLTRTGRGCWPLSRRLSSPSLAAQRVMCRWLASTKAMMSRICAHLPARTRIVPGTGRSARGRGRPPGHPGRLPLQPSQNRALHYLRPAEANPRAGGDPGMAREVHGAGVTARAPGRCRARTASSPGVSAVNDGRSVVVLRGRLNWRPFRLDGPGLAADRRRGLRRQWRRPSAERDLAHRRSLKPVTAGRRPKISLHDRKSSRS
jgi:hypothetical protein